MIKRILVALSGTSYTASAIQYAIELAKLHEADLTGVTITNSAELSNTGPAPIGGGAAATELAEYRREITQEHVEEAISTFEDACREAGVSHAIRREEGNACEELVSLWRYHDLTIFGLRGLFEYGVVQNPDDMLIQIIREGVRPLLAVAETYRPVKRVLIAYNGSMPSAKAMKHFIQYALWPDLVIKIVCFDMEGEEADQLLEDAQGYCRSHGYDVETELVNAPPRDSLIDHATQWKADIIVMGSSAHSRMSRFVFGDTALNIIQTAHIPLYLAR